VKVASARVRALNSLLYIRDIATAELPDVDGDAAVWATPSCVAVSCLPDCDGETEILLGPSREVGLRGKPLFDDQLKTPSKSVVVETVLQEIVLRLDVPHRETRLRIWTSGHQAADKVIFGLE
jgi:hypothetical protein